VSHAGLMPVMALTEWAGSSELISNKVATVPAATAVCMEIFHTVGDETGDG
jgi:hypothetical protein